MKINHFDEDNHLTKETIAWVAENLGKEEDKLPEEIKEHIEECTKCKQDIFLAREVFNFQEETQGIHTTRKSPGWYSIAAVIIIAVTLVPWLLYVVSNTDPKQENQVAVINADTTKTDTTIIMDIPRTIQVERQILTSNFTPVPQLELLIGEAQRSSEIKILSPAPDQIYDKEILFKWEGKADILRIMNNKEEKIIESPLEGNEYLFNKKLEPGLYYWLIENRSEVIAVGKFQKK